MPSHKEFVSEYLRAIESHDVDRVATFLHPEVEVVEHPNKINPAGVRYDRSALRAAGERGASALASERYDVRAMTCEGARVVAQMLWTATLHDGRTMTAHICSVIEIRDGKIWRQEQYDCFG